MNEYPIGTVIYLKSGSPALTISQEMHDDLIEVDWFAGEELKRDCFHKDQLTTEDLNGLAVDPFMYKHPMVTFTGF